MPVQKYILFFFYFAFFSLIASGNAISVEDTSGSRTISKIIISGNKKTKRHIITRELTFSEGDTILVSNYQEEIERNRRNIINTSLFTAVNIHFNPDSISTSGLVVTIQVTERWYTFPIPIFELADRNFNVWWEEFDASLRRVEYGIRFFQENVRGRNEQLKLVIQLGFTHKYELRYTFPYINKKQTLGLSANIHYSQNKQITYRADHNKLLFLAGEHFIRRRFKTGISFNYRQRLYSKHAFLVEFQNNLVTDTVVKLNENYFLENQLNQKFFKLLYSFEFNKTDLNYYPREGHYFKAELAKFGAGIFNTTDFTEGRIEFSRYLRFGNKWLLAAQSKLKHSFPLKQPFYNQQNLGFYQDFVRGYELYVINGQSFALFKSSLKFALIEDRITIKNVPVVKERYFSNVPVNIYFKIYSDMGYAWDKFHYFYNNRLHDTLLYGYGAGLDFVTYYDSLLRLEFSINSIKETGFFLHFKSAF